MVAISITMRSAIGRTALHEYPPGVVNPSTVGSGRRVSRFTPITLRMVLIALTPWQPPRNAARLGSVMRVTFGVIFAQTGFFAAAITQPQTSSTISGFSPIAAPILRSGKPCGQEKFSSNESTPASSQRWTISIQASLLYSSMIEAMSTPSGNRSLHFLNSSSQISNGRSLINSMFSQPMTSLRIVGRAAWRSAG